MLTTSTQNADSISRRTKPECRPAPEKKNRFFARLLFPLLLASLFIIDPLKSKSQLVEAWGDAAPAAWTASTLNDARSDYFQGEVIPFVYKFSSTGFTTGNSYTFNIKYDYYISSGNAGGYAYITTYDVSRDPDESVIGAAPAIDNTVTTANVGKFYTVNADVTSAEFLADAVSGNTTAKQVAVTFTFTGTPGNDIIVYWGLFLSKKGSVPDQGSGVTQGAAHWPGGSLQVTVSGTGGGGNVGNNPGAGGVVEGVISGLKYGDTDMSGTKNGSEAGLSGWTIYLDIDNSNTLNAGDVSLVTAAGGLYSFGDLLPGTFTVREVIQSGWSQTQPGGPDYEYSITIDAANSSHPDNNFGNFQCPSNGGTATAGASPICSGTSTSITLSSFTGSIVKWQYNDDGSWHDIVSTSNPLNTGNLSATTIFRAVVQTGACGEQNSSEATVTVQSLSVGGTATATTSPICAGTGTTISLSGQTGNIVKWQYNDDGSWHDIVSTSNPLNTGNLSVTTQFRAIVQNGTCATTESSAATVNVDQASVGGTASAITSPVCAGTGTTISLSGNTGSIVKWQYNNDGTWYDIASTDNPLSTGNLSVATQFRAIVQNGTCSQTNSSAVTVNITQPVSVSAWTGDVTVTYPNNATFTVAGSNITSKQWQEKSTASGAIFQNLSGETGWSLTLMSPPVSTSGYMYKVILGANSPCPDDYRAGTLTVNPASLCLTYEGITFGTTNTNGCYVVDNGYGAGVIRIIMTVVGTPPGDISTAVVKVTIPGGGVNNQEASYVAASGSNAAYYYYDWSVPCLGNTVNSVIYELSWSINGNYTSGTCNETGALITISRPTTDFTTGGGYIYNNKSKGTIGIATDEIPTKNNYGFNLKWGNNLKVLQGNVNTIVRQGGMQYQIKSNKPTLLSTKALTPYVIGSKTYYPYEAVMAYENAVFKNMTLGTSTGGGPTSIVYLRVVDNGEPNTSGTPRIDQISILYKLNNVVIYSSEEYTVINNPAVIKLMDIVKGNIQVHVQGQKNETRESVQLMEQVPVFEMRVASNPTSSSFRISITSDRNEKMELRVTDLLGRTVQTFKGLSSGTTMQIGSAYKPGLYFVEIVQGSRMKRIRIIKY